MKNKKKKNIQPYIFSTILQTLSYKWDDGSQYKWCQSTFEFKFKNKTIFFVSFDLKFNSGRGNLNSIVIVFCLSKIVCKHKNISLLLLSRDFYIFAPLNSKINTKNYSNTIHKQKESGKAGKFKEKFLSSLKKKAMSFQGYKIKILNMSHTPTSTQNNQEFWRKQKTYFGVSCIRSRRLLSM